MSVKDEMSRRDVVKAAGAIGVTAAAALRTEGFPAIQKVRAANDQVQFGMIGTGSRGSYHLKHLKSLDSARCVALCDIQQTALDHGVQTIGNNPKTYKDYRELLAQKDVEAVFVTTPVWLHFQMTRDALQAGKHVFCEKCLVFKPEEVHELRALYSQFPKQVLQTGLQRRYSRFYQMVKQMVDKGILGEVKHIHAQWHRNMVNTPSSLWTMKPGGPSNPNNWRLYRQFSGGYTAELASHQVDVADWMFGSSPDFVMGLGGLDTLKDGRDVYDNIQLIYQYSGGRKFTYSAISTNQFCPYFDGQRHECGEIIMGTEGTIETTVGDDVNHAVAWWYPEPPKRAKLTNASDKKSEKFVAGATMVTAGGPVRPIPLPFDDMSITGNDGFLTREAKFARRWLYSKGIMTQQEEANPVDTEQISFFQNCRDLKTPRADINVGLADAVAVILSNLAMDEGRKVYYSEMEKLGLPGEAKPAKKA